MKPWLLAHSSWALSLVGGQLLLLNNTEQVSQALRDSQVGNVRSDYRIDGWSGGKWFEGALKSSPSEIVFGEQDANFGMSVSTLSMDLEDGSIYSSRHMKDKIGAVCQSQGKEAATAAECQENGI